MTLKASETDSRVIWPVLVLPVPDSLDFVLSLYTDLVLDPNPYRGVGNVTFGPFHLVLD